MSKHEIRKVRLEAVWRTLTVVSKHFVTPEMLRLSFYSTELATFQSPSPDDHVKLLLPSPSSQTGTVMRDFTPRAWDATAGTFVLEFAMHGTGPAIEWARSAQTGDTLQIGGPRGSVVIPDDFDWYLLLGDSTALPSIARRLERLRVDALAIVLARISGKGEIQQFEAACECRDRWLFTTGNAERDLVLLKASLSDINLPPGDGFIWAAGEATFAKVLYAWATEERKHPAEWVKVAEYWRSANVAE